MNRDFARHRIQLQALAHCLTFAIGGNREGLVSIEFAAGAFGGKSEDHDRARKRLMVFVLHLYHRVSSQTLADIVGRALAFDHRQIQGSGKGLRLRRQRCN